MLASNRRSDDSVPAALRDISTRHFDWPDYHELTSATMTADEITTEVRALKRRFLHVQHRMGTCEEAQDRLTAKHLKLEHQMQAIEKERDGLIEKEFKAQRDMQAYEEAHDRFVEKLRASGYDL